MDEDQSNLNETRFSNIFSKIEKRNKDENLFRLKPKRPLKNAKITDNLECEFTGCSQKNVDLIKCSGCSKWICEDCNDVPVLKLKQIMNKCRTVYVLCTTCDAGIPETGISSHENESNLVNSFNTILDKKVAQLETKLETVIETKMEVVKNLNEKLKNINEQSANSQTYAKKVTELPNQMRKIIQEAKQEEKVGVMESERRARNLIIHGAIEIGQNQEEIKDEDNKYVKEILSHLKLDFCPESVIRLGKSNEGKKRTMKIVMKTKDEKEAVIKNLKSLKGTEDRFGKISITQDFTESDRLLIKEFSEKARQKCIDNPDRIYKVRGDPNDPKNGLRIISFKATQKSNQVEIQQ